MNEELEVTQRELVEKIQGIDLQLTTKRTELEALRTRLHPEDYRGYRREYEDWRSKALKARQAALDDLRRVKAMIHSANVEAREDEASRLYRAISRHRQRVYDAGYEPTEVDRELWDEIDRR